MSDETQPLLGAVPTADGTALAAGTTASAVATAVQPHGDDNDDDECHHHHRYYRYYRRLSRLSNRQLATLLSTLSIFLAELALNTMMPAISSMIEDILCREFFGDSGIANDPRCKADAVQRRLAAIRGWQTAAECIPCTALSPRLPVALCFLSLTNAQPSSSRSRTASWPTRLGANPSSYSPLGAWSCSWAGTWSSVCSPPPTIPAAFLSLYCPLC